MGFTIKRKFNLDLLNKNNVRVKPLFRRVDVIGNSPKPKKRMSSTK